jgi:hypothetical protein
MYLFFVIDGAFGIGMCIMNSRGPFINALTKWYQSIPRPFEGDAWGLRDVILWLSLFSLLNKFIELDYKLVVDNIVHSSNIHSEFGNIMATCRAMLQQFLNLKYYIFINKLNFPLKKIEFFLII